MKHLILALALLVAVAGTTQAQKKEKAAAKSAKSEIVKEAKMVCPVTGEEADPEVSYIHKGTKYYFCCTGCVSKFKKNPDKFIKASAKSSFDPCDDHKDKDAKPEGAKSDDAKSNAQAIRWQKPQADAAVINTGKDLSAQIVNEKCPVMSGKKVDKSVTTVTYKGKVYGFCCKSCIKKFAANPDKYLAPAAAPAPGTKVDAKQQPKKM